MELLMIKAEVSQTISKVWGREGLVSEGLCVCVEWLAQSLDVEGLVLKAGHLWLCKRKALLQAQSLLQCAPWNSRKCSLCTASVAKKDIKYQRIVQFVSIFAQFVPNTNPFYIESVANSEEYKPVLFATVSSVVGGNILQAAVISYKPTAPHSANFCGWPLFFLAMLSFSFLFVETVKLFSVPFLMFLYRMYQIRSISWLARCWDKWSVLDQSYQCSVYHCCEQNSKSWKDTKQRDSTSGQTELGEVTGDSKKTEKEDQGQLIRGDKMPLKGWIVFSWLRHLRGFNILKQQIQKTEIWRLCEFARKKSTAGGITFPKASRV